MNSRTMTQLGVKYFAPLQVYTSDFHPYVLFVQNMDSVIILDITRQGPILLAVVESPGSKEPGPFKFQVAIAQGHLILVNPPNTIEEHSLQELTKTRKAPVTKSYPLYGYTIPDNFDLDFSDDGNLVYITALDPKLPNTTNSVILVYKSGVPAVSTFYDVFHLNARYDEILIDVTGVFGDYIAVAIGSMLLMFRQYEIPILVLEDIWYDYSFNITYTNDP